MTLLQDGMVLTAGRMTEEIGRQVAAAIADLVPSAPAAGGGASLTRHVATNRITGMFGYAVGDITVDQTYHHVRTLESAPAWVRFVWPYDKDDTCTIVGALVAPTASVASPLAPVDSTGSPVSWTTVTFNNGGDPLTLAEQLALEDEQAGADVTTIALNVPPLNGIEWPSSDRFKDHGHLYSDWIPVAHYPRTDTVGAPPAIMDRVYFSGAPSASQAVSASWHAAAGSRLCRTYVNAGDCITDPTDFVSTSVNTSLLGTPIVQYITASPTITVAVVGDSTQAVQLNHVSKAVLALSSAAQPIEVAVWATGGYQAEAYCGNMRRCLAATQPAVVFIEMRSPNGNLNLADMESDWQVGMQLAEAVKAYGGVPVLMTPLPCPARATTAAHEESLRTISTRCRAAEAAGARILDLDAYYTNGATPIAGFRTGTSDDGLHPNQAGQDACAVDITIPLLRDILGL